MKPTVVKTSEPSIEDQIREAVESTDKTPAFGHGAAAAIASAVEKVSDDCASRYRELAVAWEGIKAEGDAVLADLKSGMDAHLDVIDRRSKKLQENIEAFARSTHATRVSIHAAADATRMIDQR
jgi:hypothetical protein